MDERIKIANEMIKIISDYGRRFFFNNKDNSVGHFKIKNGRIYFVSEYSKREIYLHYKYWTFHHGGTLRALVDALREYIQGRKDLPLRHLGPWPDTLCGGDLWGYGDDMKIVREKCSLLTLTTEGEGKKTR